MAELQTLLKTQGRLKDIIDSDYSNFKKANRGRKSSPSFKEAQLKSLQEKWDEFKENHAKIDQLADTDEPCYTALYNEVSATYAAYHAKITALPIGKPLGEDGDGDADLAIQQKKQAIRFESTRKVLNEIEDKIENQLELTTAYCKVKIKYISEYWQRISVAHENLAAEAGPLPIQYGETISDLEADMNTLMLVLQEILETPKETIKQEGVKLQRISIPTFNGDYFQWTSFRDLFISMVKDNKSLADAQKLQILKTNVEGEAEGLINDLSISNANFEEAWNRLIARYDNNRIMVSKHLHQLITQQATKTKATSIKNLLDTTDQLLLALKNMGRPIDKWDDWIIITISQKLSDEVRKDWEKKIGEYRNLPTWLDLKNFLEEEFRMLEGVESMYMKGNATKDQQNNGIKSYQASIDKRKCPLCKDEANSNIENVGMKILKPGTATRHEAAGCSLGTRNCIYECNEEQ